MAGDKVLADFATPQAQSYGKKTKDVWKEELGDARYIGGVRLNHTRLNVFSRLAETTDEQDHFHFKVYSHGDLRLGMTDNPDLRVQILDKRGKVIADNNPDADKDLFQKFREFNEEGSKLVPGDYFLRVSRMDESTIDDQVAYSLQLSMGTARNDLDTVEYTADPVDPVELALSRANANAPARVLTGMGAATLLSDGMLNFLALTQKDDDSSGGLF